MGNSYDKNIEKAKRFIFLSLLLSFFMHVIVIGVNWIGSSKSPNTAESAKKEKVEKLRVVLRRSSKPKQIVTSEESDTKERAKDAKYLGKTTQTFLKESSARNVGSFKKAGKGARQGIKQPSITQEMIKKVKVAKAKKEVKKMAMKKTDKKSKFKKKVSLADLAAPKVQPEKVVEKRKSPSLAALGLKNGQAKESGLSANNDFVEDVPLGDMTRLNTVEYKYYGFYHRIKQKLEQYWGNSIQKKAHALWKSGRRMPASENKITSLEVTLDKKGKIVSVNVKGSSGVRELDEAAVESFNQAGPFPNPPKGMVKNGRARIQWGFVVKS